VGIAPDNILLSISIFLRSVSSPILVGIGPLTWFVSKLMD